MIAADVIEVLDGTGRLCRTVDIPTADRDPILAAIHRLEIDLTAFAERLGVDNKPRPVPPAKPPPPPPPPPKGCDCAQCITHRRQP